MMSNATFMRLPYVPGLDGLRAIAVLGVLVYHGAPSLVPGGFLGVEVFFVLSGYLITSLLLAEWRYTGHVDLRRFWLRRVRRLLPALLALLAVTLTITALFLPGPARQTARRSAGCASVPGQLAAHLPTYLLL